MGFNDRVVIGTQWDNDISKNLKTIGFKIGRYNIENVAPDFSSDPHYANSDNPSILFARHFPDGIATDFKNNVSFFWDAKNGGSIEKNAYLTYCNLAKNGVKIILFIKNYTDYYCIPIESVVFCDSTEYVSKFSEEKRIPVEDGWICPRQLPEKRYIEWKKRCPNASGTPFKYVDFKKLKSYKIVFPFEYNIIEMFV